MKMKTKEEILNNIAKTHMIQWNLAHFEKTHTSLLEAIYLSMDAYSDQTNKALLDAKENMFKTLKAVSNENDILQSQLNELKAENKFSLQKRVELTEGLSMSNNIISDLQSSLEASQKRVKELEDYLKKLDKILNFNSILMTPNAEFHYEIKQLLTNKQG